VETFSHRGAGPLTRFIYSEALRTFQPRMESGRKSNKRISPRPGKTKRPSARDSTRAVCAVAGSNKIVNAKTRLTLLTWSHRSAADLEILINFFVMEFPLAV
jgi:hypothetical protein